MSFGIVYLNKYFPGETEDHYKNSLIHERLIHKLAVSFKDFSRIICFIARTIFFKDKREDFGLSCLLVPSDHRWKANSHHLLTNLSGTTTNTWIRPLEEDVSLSASVLRLLLVFIMLICPLFYFFSFVSVFSVDGESAHRTTS
jgi:hypothetical protein